VGHGIQIEVLAALHEGPASANDLSQIIRQPVEEITRQLEELLGSGSIEIARTEQMGTLSQSFYRVVRLPFFSDKDWAVMAAEERRVTSELILQASMAEALASLWAGKLHRDPRVMLAWNRISLDAQGREDLADEQGRSWERMKEIEAEAASRRIVSGEPSVTYVITSLGYERGRTSAPAPIPSGES
jgi:hypothetical protein